MMKRLVPEKGSTVFVFKLPGFNHQNYIIM